MELKEVKKREKDVTLSSASEVAEFMGIHYQTLYRLVKNGKIKAINIAQSGIKPIFRFRAEDIQAYYDSLSPSNYPVETKHE